MNERRDEDLAREVDAHLSLIEDDFARKGFTAVEAKRRARLAIGGATQTRERARDARRFSWLDDAVRDIRYALRSLERTPGFAAIAILTLALGIGANTAIFSVVHAVLLAPLPYKSPGQLVRLYENVPAAESFDGKPRRFSGVDVRDVLAIKSNAQLLSDVTVDSVGFALVSISGGLDTIQRQLTFVTPETFPLLGMQPVVGRWFSADEATEKVLILSYAAWQRYFGGTLDVVGKTLTFNGNTFFTAGVTLGADYTVIGVMPRSFPDDLTYFWAPTALTPPADGRPRRQGLLARLADGTTPEAAAGELAGIVRGARGSAWGSKQPGGTSTIQTDSDRPRFELVRLQDETGASVRDALWILTAAVGLVLLIACANVANLLLSRTAARQRELAVRVAIGAGRGRLVRQLLAESVLLAAVSGTLGILLAAGGVALFRGLATNLPRIDLGAFGTTFPRLDAIAIDGPVLLFAVVASIATGVGFGLVPAAIAARGAQMEVLRGATGSTTGSRRHGMRAQDVFVVAQVALAMVLLIGGGLMIHTFLSLVRVELGFNPSSVLTFQATLPGGQRPVADLKTFANALATRLESVPGIEAAAYANQVPLVALQNSLRLRTSAALPDPATAFGPVRSDDLGGDARLVSWNYLKTMGIRVVEGRPFARTDTASAPHVIIVNRTLARKFPSAHPVGATVYMGRDTTPWEVIGVADDVRQMQLDRRPEPQWFALIDQWELPNVPLFPTGAYYAVRTSARPTTMASTVHDIVHQLEPRASVENVATMDEIVASRLNRPKMYAVLLGIFAAVAGVLAVAGIYGVMSYAVARRTKEIGIRMALGAERGNVLRLVLGQSARLSSVGILFGIGGATIATKYLETFLFGVTPLDVTTFAAVGIAFFGTALIAAYVPARRATRVDPLVALRYD